MSELIDDLMEGIDVTTSNDIALKKLKNFKNCMLKSINNLIYILKVILQITPNQILKRKILKITSNQILT